MTRWNIPNNVHIHKLDVEGLCICGFRLNAPFPVTGAPSTMVGTVSMAVRVDIGASRVLEVDLSRVSLPDAAKALEEAWLTLMAIQQKQNEHRSDLDRRAALRRTTPERRA